MPKRKSKNTEALKSITSQLEAVKEIQAGQEEAGVAAGETLESISTKVSKMVGVLARNAARVKANETRLTSVEKDVEDIYEHLTKPEEEKPAESVTTASIGSIAASVESLSHSLGIMEGLLQKAVESKKADEYKKKETELEAPSTKSPVAQKIKTEEDSSFGTLIKSFFTNPAVIAAFSGLVYLLLPKDVKEKITAFFQGFAEGGDKTSKELSTFEIALMTAAGGLATYLGASLLKSIGEAIIITLSLIKKSKGVLSKFGKKGAIAAAAGLAAAGAAIAMTGDEEKATAGPEPEPGKPPEPTPVPTQEPAAAPTPVQAAAPVTAPPPGPPAPIPEIKAPPSTGLKPGGGVGLKPGGGVGIKMPDETIGDAIRTAAKRVGVDESIMLAMAKQESGFNPSAKAGTSSAKGLYQFIDSSWNEMVKKYGAQFTELSRGPMDALASAIAGALYIKENSRFLEKNNIPVNGTTIYASHFLGAGGARKLLTSDPNASAADMLPQAAAANKPIFFDKAGNARTIGQVIEVLYGKVGRVAEQYAAALAPTAQPGEPVSGNVIAKASEGVEAASAPRTGNIVTNVAGGPSVVQTGKGQQAPREIPNPVANRGSLNNGVRHSTATA